MRRARIAFLVVASLTVAGCYQSTQVGEDAGVATDGAPDDAPPGECSLPDGVERCRSEACEVCTNEDLDCFFLTPTLDGWIDEEIGGACLGGTRGDCRDFNCDSGYLCTFFHSFFLDGGAIDRPTCVPAADCVRVRDAFEQTPAAGCWYGDRTPAITAVRPRVDCAERAAPGLCGEGCACDDGSECRFPSEVHPWGICASLLARTRCVDATPCGDASCLTIRAPAEVGERFFPLAFEESYCARRPECEALASAYPDAYSCP